jgi:hypothetical protein
MLNELLSIQLDISTDFTSDDSRNDFWFINSVDQSDSPSTFELRLSGTFSQPTVGYLYISIPSLDCPIEQSNCLYPGTLFPFDVPAFTSNIMMNNLNIREAFRTFQDNFDTNPKIYPQSFSIDVLIPLNNYFDLNSPTTYTISMSIPSINNPTSLQYSFSHELSSEVRTDDPIYENASTYTGWSAALKSINLDKYGLQFALKTRSRGDFSPRFSQPVNLMILSLSRLQRVGISGTSTECGFSASRIDKFFWDIVVSNMGRITITWALDSFPSTLNINCSHEYRQNSPSHFYLYTPQNGLRVYRYSDANVSIYPIVSKAIPADSSYSNNISNSSDSFGSTDTNTSTNPNDLIQNSLLNPSIPLYALQIDSNLPVELSKRSGSNDGDLPVGAIIGIVIGGVVAIVIIILIIICCCVCNQRANNAAVKPSHAVSAGGNDGNDGNGIKQSPYHQSIQIANYPTTDATPASHTSTQPYPTQAPTQQPQPQPQYVYPDPGQQYQQHQHLQQQYTPTAQPQYVQKPYQPYTPTQAQPYYETPVDNNNNNKGGEGPPSYDTL